MNSRHAHARVAKGAADRERSRVVRCRRALMLFCLKTGHQKWVYKGVQMPPWCFSCPDDKKKHSVRPRLYDPGLLNCCMAALEAPPIGRRTLGGLCAEAPSENTEPLQQRGPGQRLFTGQMPSVPDLETSRPRDLEASRPRSAPTEDVRHRGVR